ncbi:unnamed protein product [Ceratitis capitata]|uniref:(Mediterranean fruit fly) hypothetical protein n=1 Tax=Ceratitis capitata TaxID=7213 RepID=A0A811UPZ5_CERCA|nr:unnamed protein product [Ceratitis capitata]CAD7001170.1 unnamed protein product [Ceratitis capitata]
MAQVNFDPLKYLSTLPTYDGDLRDLQTFINLNDRVHPILQTSEQRCSKPSPQNKQSVNQQNRQSNDNQHANLQNPENFNRQNYRSSNSENFNRQNYRNNNHQNYPNTTQQNHNYQNRYDFSRQFNPAQKEFSQQNPRDPSPEPMDINKYELVGNLLYNPSPQLKNVQGESFQRNKVSDVDRHENFHYTASENFHI